MPVKAEIATPRARAAWSFSGKSQQQLAQETGLTYGRIRALLATSNTTEVALDELHKIADACGVPRAFMENGFGESAGVVTPADLDALRAELSAQISALRRDDERSQ